MSDGVLILGGGQGGAQLAISLRENGFTAPVTVLGDEDMLPYQRPPLSKAYMAGKVEEAGLQMRNADFYRTKSIEVVTGLTASAINRATKQVVSTCGRSFAYDHLILATGTRNRMLPLDHADAPNVFYLRTVKDATALRRNLETASHAVVIGAGFIGLEFAAVAAKHGINVTVVEVAPRVMARAVSPEISSHFEAMHRNMGTKILLEQSVASLELDHGKVVAVHTVSGQRLPADLVLVGIGVLPNCELAQEAGLEVRNGIVVDEHLVTSDPTISAIGDCAVYPSAYIEGHVRLESVQNAVDQAKTLARRLCGNASAFDAAPWFWSDQGTDKLQIAGLSHADDQRVVLGDEAQARFSVLRFRNGVLCCVESVNRVADHMAARKILQGKLPLNPETARSQNFDLKSFASEFNLNIQMPQAIA